MSSSNVILSLESVSLKIGNRQVLDNISLQIHERQVFSILGPNGGGKTSLIETMLGIRKQTTGLVNVHDPKLIFGYMPQSILKKNSIPMTCLDFVCCGFYSKNSFGFYNKQDNIDKSYQLLKQIGLSDLANQSIYNTSGGQFQRLSLARSIVNKPNVLFLDEPTANSDLKAKQEILKILQEHCSSFTVVVSSHDIPWVKEISNVFFCVRCHGAQLNVTELDKHIGLGEHR